LTLNPGTGIVAALEDRIAIHGGLAMAARNAAQFPRLAALGVVLFAAGAATACCPASFKGVPVVNADQTVLMIWDAEHQMQHFIRQASFKSQGAELGFLVPTPTQPELEESGDAAFTKLQKITAPEVQRVWQPHNPFACGSVVTLSDAHCGGPPAVRVLEEKRVAGINAAVLETNSSTALVDWLKEHEYAYTPEIASWAEPYVEDGWKITALKVAKDPANRESKDVSAAALRISFHTDRPIFPYREPDTRAVAARLGVDKRILRIYFLAESQYEGQFDSKARWTGQVVWAGKVSSRDRKELLDQLHLTPATGPKDWYLTEFEDEWPYRPAPSDLHFSPTKQEKVRRPPVIQYIQSSYPTDVTLYALATMMVVPVVWTRVRRSPGPKGTQSCR
jgi:hypothetical protein